MFRCLPFKFSLFLLFANAGSAAPTVSLSYGTLQGFTESGVTKYLGVPFASSSRFEAPSPPKVLHGVQNATEFGPACPQQLLSSPPGTPFSAPIFPSISEDCLTVDVFVPSGAHNLSALPVFVWIYGGGFTTGNSRTTEFSPLVERSVETGEPIIIVVPNYRLSAFGFLPGKEVGAAGESGAPNLSPTLAEGQPVYDALVLANNCTAARDTLDCLRHVPLESFMATVNQTENFMSYESLALVWRPYIDGDVVERAPVKSVAEGLFAHIPIMAGNSDDEGTLFSISTLNITTDAEFLGYLHSNILPKTNPDQVAQLGLLYPDDPTQGAPFDTGSANQLSPEYKRLAALQGDLTFIGPRRLFLEHTSRTQPTWSWLSKLGKNASEFGAAHGNDQGVWFTNTTALQTLGMDALVNFINTLDPNTPAVAGSAAELAVAWPQWKTGGGSLWTFSDPDTVSVTKEDFRVEAMAYLNGLLLEEAAEC
ncbi:carotenoid ester lipase precursor [Mycena filopes]|nr:carotenoid ester lipase precursor [Mycena filopes]